MKAPALLLLLALAVTTSACAGAEALRRKEGPAYRAETHSWHHLVQRHGRNGDWLVVRGYHRGDDVVAVATNAPLSHAVILDHDAGEIIEAVGDGVRVAPLGTLLRESHRVQLIRPEGWTRGRGAEAVRRARSQVGKGYDFLGIVGAPDKNRWYCSELAAWSMGVPVDKLGAWHVLHPKDLHRKGALLFDSGSRDGVPDQLPASSPADVPGSDASSTPTATQSGTVGP
ncbi:MAG: hypothetical protein H6747_16515 [Deltaproteobacteria bacterium]|nr:hypothetical protein [Deltaproteobacteria bacterium]